MNDLCEAHFWVQANNKALSFLKYVNHLAGQPNLPKPETFLLIVNVVQLLLFLFPLLCSAPPFCLSGHIHPA